MYISLIVLSVCIGGALSCCLSCCSPEQWEAVVSIVGAYDGSNGEGLILSKMKASYDAKTQKMVARTVSRSRGRSMRNPAHVLKDYSRGVQYVVPANRSSCQVSRIDRTFPHACVPDSAFKTGDAYVGIGSNVVFEENLSLPPGRAGLIMFTINKEKCMPSRQMFLGYFDGMQLSSIVFFGNTTLGIENPSVFDIPAVCKNQPVPVEPATGGPADFYKSYNIFRV